jgi:hypothetical protein
MPYNTKALKTDVSGVKPAPQHFDPGIDDYDVALGRNGASRVELYGPDGTALKSTEGKLDIRAGEIEALLAILNNKDFSTDAKLEAVRELLVNLNSKDFATQTTLAQILAKIIAAPATEAKQDALNALVGEAQAAPTANTLLARLKNLETKVDAIIADGLKLSGSNVEIGGVSFVVSGGDTIRGKAADKPAAAAAHAVIPYCFYFSIDTGEVEATDGTNWVVM